MELTPREKDKLLVFVAAQVASARKARGVKLNYPESVALISRRDPRRRPRRQVGRRAHERGRHAC